MLEPRGAVVVCGDYKGKVSAICKVLNSLICNLDGAEFVTEGRRILVNSNRISIPSVYFDRLEIGLADGTAVYVDDHASMNKLLDDDGETIGGDAVPLDVLSQRISPLLTQGTIELVAVAHGGNGHAYFERLAIRHDGLAERERRYFNSFEQHSSSENEIERFDPNDVKEAA